MIYLLLDNALGNGILKTTNTLISKITSQFNEAELPSSTTPSGDEDTTAIGS